MLLHIARLLHAPSSHPLPHAPTGLPTPATKLTGLEPTLSALLIYIITACTVIESLKYFENKFFIIFFQMKDLKHK